MCTNCWQFLVEPNIGQIVCGEIAMTDLEYYFHALRS